MLAKSKRRPLARGGVRNEDGDLPGRLISFENSQQNRKSQAELLAGVTVPIGDGVFRVAYKRREIALTYDALARERLDRSKPRLAALRCADLERWFAHRYGEQPRSLLERGPSALRYRLPDDDGGRDDAYIMLHHLAWRGENNVGLRWWLGKRAPWMAESDAQKLISKVLSKPRKWTADALGDRLGMTDEVRTLLGITTFGGVDVARAERRAKRDAGKVARKKAKRRESGMKPREQSYSRTQPWLAFGIKRRAWERRGKPVPPSDDANMTPTMLSKSLSRGSNLRRDGERKAAARESAHKALAALGRGTDWPNLTMKREGIHA
ncbi:MAG: hypothetical protein WA210_18125 [Burkholderiaceae bacterium]